MKNTLLRIRRTPVNPMEFFQKTLDALQAHIAILDDSGTIIAVNATWNRFASANDLEAESCGPGANYLKVCDEAYGDGSEEARIVAARIRQMTTGEWPGFYLEYPCHSPSAQRWFGLRITRFETDRSVRVVVAHDDITARKLAERALQSDIARRVAPGHARDRSRTPTGLFHDLPGWALVP